MHVNKDFVYLSDDALNGLGITPSEVADVIELALRDKIAGRLHTAPKSAIMPGDGRYMVSTLAVGDRERLTVLKAVTVTTVGARLGLPAINGSIIAMDADTGMLKAIIDANWVTAVRTAALSTVAARRLANPASTSVAFIGTGVQAHSHLAAFAELFPLTEIRAFGRGQTNRDKLCHLAQEMGLRAIAAQTAEEALRGADLVVTSVTLDYTIKPFLDAGWMKPGSFAAITDLGIPWHQDSMSAFGTLVIDDQDQEDSIERKLAPPDLVQTDLTGLLRGTPHVAHDPDKPNCFAFRGIALGDYAATALVVERAQAQHAGLKVPPSDAG